MVLSNGESWIHHVLVQHPGLVMFLALDIVILLPATGLTVTQAIQVSTSMHCHLLHFLYYISRDCMDELCRECLLLKCNADSS